MRKVIVGAFVSMDGVMQAPGGPEEDPTGGFTFGGWVAPFADADPVFGEEVGKLFSEPFDLLLGRRTYDIFAAHWPYAEGGPYDDIARTFNRITKYVATRKGADLTWRGSVALRDAARDVAILKQKDGPALVTQGSTEVVHALLAAGLVDEIRTFTFPVLLGKGKRLFSDDSQPRAFTLTHSAVSPNGLIAATYARAGEVETATIGGAVEPSPAELARREKLTREAGSGDPPPGRAPRGMRQ
jgi:dihydrofolate reductase